MIEVHWDPMWHLGPIPVNWYGLGWAAAFIVGAALAPRCLLKPPGTAIFNQTRKPKVRQ